MAKCLTTNIVTLIVVAMNEPWLCTSCTLSYTYTHIYTLQLPCSCIRRLSANENERCGCGLCSFLQCLQKVFRNSSKLAWDSLSLPCRRCHDCWLNAMIIVLNGTQFVIFIIYYYFLLPVWISGTCSKKEVQSINVSGFSFLSLWMLCDLGGCTAP